MREKMNVSVGNRQIAPRGFSHAESIIACRKRLPANRRYGQTCYDEGSNLLSR